MVIKNKTCLRPVSLCESGEGLPYAPVNWPNPGDIWSWKVGRRISNLGFHKDRFLIGPISLQKDQCKRLHFKSKKSVEDYLRSEFPDTSVDAFFASFVWKIPANLSSMKKGQIRFCTVYCFNFRKMSSLGFYASSLRLCGIIKCLFLL